MADADGLEVADRVVAACAIAVLLVVHGLVVFEQLPRALDHDEGEHLRAAAWMASGRTIYRDFVENHAPFLYLILERFAPPGNAPISALRSYVTSARTLTALAGTLAAICVAAFALRVSGSGVAAVAALAPLLAAGWTWLRGVADIRAEPFTLLLFWGGVLLLTGRRPLLAGAGIGLIAAAAVWNPKWPVESLVMFLWFVWRLIEIGRRSRRLALISLAIGAAIPLAFLAVVLRATTLHELIFFAYTYPAELARWFASSDPILNGLKSSQSFAFCSLWFWPRWVIVALLMLLAMRFRRWRDSPLVVLSIALVLASGVEVRFLYSYPRLWPQYFVMWGCCAALLYGVVAAEISSLRRAMAIAFPIGIALVFAFFEIRIAREQVDESHWALKRILHDRLQPGEAAWVRPEEYPQAVPAGSYYWYAFSDQVPHTLQYAHRPPANRFLPPLGDGDLPPCRVLNAHRAGAGADYVHVRWMDQRAVRNLPLSARCFQELIGIGALRRIGPSPIWEVKPPPRRQLQSPQ